MLFTSSDVSGRRGSMASSALSMLAVAGALRRTSLTPRVCSPRVWSWATCVVASSFASAICSALNHGSPKPANALRLAGAGGRLLSVPSEATDGSCVMPALRIRNGIFL